MSDSIARLATRVVQDWYNDGHRTYLAGDMNAIADIGALVAALAVQVAAHANAASASYALQAALGTAADGVGNEPQDVPRLSMLGSGAVQEDEVVRGLHPNSQAGAYQITAHDFGKLLLAPTGSARTFTCPLATDLPAGWWCMVCNFSGNNLTLALTGGSETINGGTAGASATVASSNDLLILVRTSSTTFRVG